MNQAHTPGPWKVSNGGIMGPDFPNDISHFIGTVQNGEVTTAANAALIAAAPDLLESCLNLVAACELTDDAYYDAIDTAINIARAAIAKAKGGAA